MVPLLVVLTFVAFVALDRYVLSKGYLDVKSGWPAKLDVLSLAAARELVPAGVFLQPTYTWSRITAGGGVYFGIHPTLLGLVGPHGELELRREGERVEKGEALVRVGAAGRRLTLRAPVAGRVAWVNRRATRGAPWWRDVAADGDPWLYRMQLDHVADEAAHWLSGDAALEWTRLRYEELRAFLLGAGAPGRLGAVMTDGGEVPVGILASLDQGVWTELEARFLAPPARP
jgi:glycine cleavage system H lipoate-binding protein